MLKNAPKATFLIPIFYTIKTRGFFNLLNNAITNNVWVLFFYLLAFNAWAEPGIYTAYLAYLAFFLVLYELGYLMNDAFSMQHEKLPTIRLNQSISPWLYTLKIVLHTAILTSIAMALRPYFSNQILLGFLVLMAVFCLHNLLKPHYRMLTFFALKVLKVLAIFNYLLVLMPVQHKVLILAALMGHSAYYTFFYGAFKLNWVGNKVLNNPTVDYYRLFSMLLTSGLAILLFGYFNQATTLFLLIVVAQFFINQLLRRLKNNVISPFKNEMV